MRHPLRPSSIPIHSFFRPLLIALPLLLGAVLTPRPSAAQHGPQARERAPLTYEASAVGAEEARRWRSDLAFLAEQLPAHHADAFHAVSKEDWEAAVARLDARLPELARHQIVVELARLVAMIGDGHTSLQLYADPVVGFHVLPIRFGVYDDGLWVEAADRRYARAVGKKVVAFGSVSADEALRRVTELISHESEYWADAVAPHLLNRAEALHALGLAARLDALELTVEAAGGTQVVTIEALAEPGGGGHGLPFLPAYTDDWGDARDDAGGPVPLWQQDRGPYWYEILPESGILYVQFSRHFERPDLEIGAFAAEVRERLEDDRVDTLVLDLRRNTGGRGALNVPLVRELVRAATLDRRGSFFTIIGRRTFSAAQNLANLLETWTETTFVGEPTGSTPNSFGDHHFLTLPESGITVSVAPVWHQTAGPWDRRPYTAPRLAAVSRFEAYAANRDPALEAILRSREEPDPVERLAQAIGSRDEAAARRLVALYAADPTNRYFPAPSEINRIGYGLLHAGRAEDAVWAFRLNVDLHPEYANGWDSLGEAYAAQGERQKAIESYGRALELDPRNENARRRLRQLERR